MKKKQSPVLVGSVLVVLAGALAFYGVFFRPVSEEEANAFKEKARIEAMAAGSKARESVDKDALLKNSVQMAVKKPGPGGPPIPEEGLSATPTILKPAAFNNKPTPSDSSTSPQWYKEQSGIGKKAKPGG